MSESEGKENKKKTTAKDTLKAIGAAGAAAAAGYGGVVAAGNYHKGSGTKNTPLVNTPAPDITQESATRAADTDSPKKPEPKAKKDYGPAIHKGRTIASDTLMDLGTGVGAVGGTGATASTLARSFSKYLGDPHMNISDPKTKAALEEMKELATREYNPGDFVDKYTRAGGHLAGLKAKFKDSVGVPIEGNVGEFVNSTKRKVTKDIAKYFPHDELERLSKKHQWAKKFMVHIDHDLAKVNNDYSTLSSLEHYSRFGKGQEGGITALMHELHEGHYGAKGHPGLPLTSAGAAAQGGGEDVLSTLSEHLAEPKFRQNEFGTKLHKHFGGSGMGTKFDDVLSRIADKADIKEIQADKYLSHEERVNAIKDRIAKAYGIDAAGDTRNASDYIDNAASRAYSARHGHTPSVDTNLDVFKDEGNIKNVLSQKDKRRVAKRVYKNWAKARDIDTAADTVAHGTAKGRASSVIEDLHKAMKIKDPANGLHFNPAEHLNPASLKNNFGDMLGEELEHVSKNGKGFRRAGMMTDDIADYIQRLSGHTMTQAPKGYNGLANAYKALDFLRGKKFRNGALATAGAGAGIAGLGALIGTADNKGTAMRNAGLGGAAMGGLGGLYLGTKSPDMLSRGATKTLAKAFMGAAKHSRKFRPLASLLNSVSKTDAISSLVGKGILGGAGAAGGSLLGGGAGALGAKSFFDTLHGE